MDSIENIIKNQGKVLDHPSGLFVLFFTEMWERFSYYGMRAILVLFLVSSITGGGYGWENSDALQLYALYTGLVYFTPLFGGIIADKYLGYRQAVIIGGLIMAMGHLFMALETPLFFYLGISTLIIGNGLFKPNISSIVGKLYKDDEPEKVDSAYTIFYMGINAGAFLGILLCGFLGETIGWSYGFGLAMIFMFLGVLQFHLSKDLFGTIGEKPEAPDKDLDVEDVLPVKDSRFVMWGVIGVVLAVIVYFVNPIKDFQSILYSINSLMPSLILGATTAIVGYIMTDPSLTKVEKDRVWVIMILSFFVIFFWWAFEQAGGSLTLFAKNYTQRSLVGSSATIFKIVNTLITVIPMLVISWVLFLLFKVTRTKIAMSNMVLAFSFLIVWGIVIFMLQRQFSQDSAEVPASWFGTLNSLYIIIFAPLFSKIWERGFLKSPAYKFAVGLILLGVGFLLLKIGSSDIAVGAKTASVSLMWLVVFYLFQTIGELFISPVGLSYVSKLAPVRLVGLMFGIWFIANFAANWAAGITGSFIDPIVEEDGVSAFFQIFATITIGAGLVIALLNRLMKKLMHGVE